MLIFRSDEKFPDAGKILFSSLVSRIPFAAPLCPFWITSSLMGSFSQATATIKTKRGLDDETVRISVYLGLLTQQSVLPADLFDAVLSVAAASAFARAEITTSP